MSTWETVKTIKQPIKTTNYGDPSKSLWLNEDLFVLLMSLRTLNQLKHSYNRQLAQDPGAAWRGCREDEGKESWQEKKKLEKNYGEHNMWQGCQDEAQRGDRHQRANCTSKHEGWKKVAWLADRSVSKWMFLPGSSLLKSLLPLTSGCPFVAFHLLPISSRSFPLSRPSGFF